MRTTLQHGFPLPDRVPSWGTRVDAFGTPRANQVRVPGVVQLEGLTLHEPSVVGGARGIVRVATYELYVGPQRAEFDKHLGAAQVQAIPNQGLPHQVAETWTWDVGQGVDLAVSWFAAKRGAAVAGVFLNCSEERLAEPYLAQLTADAPWRSPGRVQPLGVEVETCTLGLAQVAMRRPGLCVSPPWVGAGIWDAAGYWGVSDGRYTSVHKGPTAWRHERTLPAKGSGGSSLTVDGVVVLVCADPYGLDEVAERLRARADATVAFVEVHDC